MTPPEKSMEFVLHLLLGGGIGPQPRLQCDLSG